MLLIDCKASRLQSCIVVRSATWLGGLQREKSGAHEPVMLTHSGSCASLDLACKKSSKVMAPRLPAWCCSSMHKNSGATNDQRPCAHSRTQRWMDRRLCKNAQDICKQVRATACVHACVRIAAAKSPYVEHTACYRCMYLVAYRKTSLLRFRIKPRSRAYQSSAHKLLETSGLQGREARWDSGGRWRRAAPKKHAHSQDLSRQRV